LDQARVLLRRISPSADFELTWRWQPQEDWESLWRRGLGPRRITSRLVVAPSWEGVEPERDEILLTLDPGMAFGTAEHATTRACLRLLDGTVLAGSRIADVGAGSGILSIAGALLGAAEVVAFEMDELACETAEENIAKNGVEAKVTVHHHVVDTESPLPGAPFDGIVANLQSHIITPLFPVFATSLVPGAWLILSGILSEERDRVLSSAGSEGFFLSEEDVEDGWWSCLLRTPGVSG
jgi:ribosomal protein L11 methyltransferase